MGQGHFWISLCSAVPRGPGQELTWVLCCWGSDAGCRIWAAGEKMRKEKMEGSLTIIHSGVNHPTWFSSF